MADIITPISNASENSSNNTLNETVTSNFLNNTHANKEQEGPMPDSLYKDLFQENINGEILIGKKSERSRIEIATQIGQYITSIIVILGILFAGHTYIRSYASDTFFSNYSFACIYLNYDIRAPEENLGCKTIATIKNEYLEKQDILEKNIITIMTDYIPIKVSSSIVDASPEKQFISNSYNSKPNIIDIMTAFDASINDYSESITCNGINITDGDTLSTQCVIYGKKIGDADSGSARIQALRFIETLDQTTKSSFILLHRPSSLNIEKLSPKEAASTNYSTRTTLPIQIRYVPFFKI